MNTETYSCSARLLAERATDAGSVQAVLLLRNVESMPEEHDAIEEIHQRAETMTSLLKGILDYQPATHWGINE